MKLTTFFEKFDLLADASGAVEKMRELLLQLAVQGRLVGQKPSEGDADSLLEEIGVARRRAKTGGLGQQADRDPLAEVPGWHQVPPTWRWVHLGAIGDIVGGGTPRSDNSAYFADEGIPWLTPADLNGFKGKRIRRGRRCITKLGLENSSAQLLPEGSVLFSSRAPIGYVAIAGTELATNQGFKSCVPFIPETNEFLYYYLMSAAARIDREASGTTFREVSGKIVSQIPVPLPPLAEQKRIVAKVDELMALCDRWEEQGREREVRHAALAQASLARFANAPTPVNLPLLFHPSYAISPVDLRKSILTLAIQGKLVPQDPNDEPAKVLLQRVDAERQQLVKSKRIRRQALLGPVAADAVPFNIPVSWQWRYLADVCFLITDGAHHTPQYLESGVPFLSVKDVSGGVIDFSSTRFISKEAHRELCKRCLPELGDILLTKVGTTGIAVIVDEDREFSIFVSLALLKFSQPNLDGRYLKHLINSPFVKQQSADNTQGIGNKNLVLRLINRFTVPIPPLAEQRRIVAKVDQLMALVDELETQLAAGLATGANLLEAVVAELTSGK